MSRAQILLTAPLLAGACAHAPPPLHSVALEIRHVQGSTQPIVKVDIDGELVPLLVDTGAGANVLSAGFAARHSLDAFGSDLAVGVQDANGNSSKMRFLPGVPVRFEGEREPVKLDFYLNDAIPPAAGPAGILSPHALVGSDGILVIDIGREQLRYELEDDALRELGSVGRGTSKVPFHRCLREGFFDHGRRIATVSVNGVDAEMLIDTGAARTVLYRNNPAIPTMLTRVGAQGRSFSLNSGTQSLILDDVPIHFAGVAVTIPVVVSPVRDICVDGLLGADVLSECALLWGSSNLWVSCRNPAQEP